MHLRNKTCIYFIRHGLTTSNEHKIKQGIGIDEYLSPHGILEIEKLVPIIKHLELDVIYTSYLRRAEETAAYINKYLTEPVQVFHDFRIRERNFGSLTGKTQKEIEFFIPNYNEQETLQIYDYTKYGGESAKQVRIRVFSSILDIATNHENQNIGIITHGGFIRMLLFHFPKIPRIYHDVDNKDEIANTDIYEWDISPGILKNIKSLIK